MRLWIVARLDVNRLPEPTRSAACSWVASLGHDPKQLRPALVVTQDERDRSYQLHLSRYVLVDGRKQIDHALDDMWSEPVVIPISEPPDWLLGAYQTQLTDGGQ